MRIKDWIRVRLGIRSRVRFLIKIIGGLEFAVKDRMKIRAGLGYD